MKQASTALSEEILKTLERKSEKSIELAKQILLAEKIESKKVHDAMAFYLSDWSPLAHPGLFAIGCESVGGTLDSALDIQATIAMLTAAVDLHDDIVDKSVRKQGRQTVFGKYGQDVSLLLGNAFFVEGFTLLGKSVSHLLPQKAIEVMEAVKQLMFEVGTAHALELDFRGKMNLNVEEYMPILEMKAASVEASMKLGALVGGGTASEVDALSKYGRILGWLATVRDEFIDIFDLHELRQRSRNECLPLPILVALKDSKSKKIRTLLSHKQLTQSDAAQILDLVLTSKGVEMLKSEMINRIQEASDISIIARKEEVKVVLKRLVQSTLEDLR